MPTPKEAIAEALQSLDHTNEALWTEDGSPLVSEIQRLTNDKTITRAQINDALPGFARKSADSITEEVQPGDEDEVASTETIVAPPEVQNDDEPAPLSDEDEYARLRQMAYQRVLDAEVVVTDAKNAVGEAQRAVVNAEARHTRALQLFSAKYPPISAAENIKLHLARQQALLRERVMGETVSPLNPVDVRLQDRKRDNGRNKRGAFPRALAAVG